MATADEIGNAFKEILPPSASASSSTPTKKVRYDVFINHRGPDAKETLANSIYDTLHGMGLQVFLDKPELDLGDSIPSEIENAMNTSFLHIAILSTRYAESPWCLAELSFMLKTGKKIIPVFYNVDPKDIHWICEGKGIYVDAFSDPKAKTRYTSETLQEWKRALQRVSYLSGYIVKNDDNEGKGKLLEAIKDYVKKQSQKFPLVVAKHPVGLDEIVQDFESNVFDSFENVKIVGIVGMGGCGKTTMAREYYNKTKDFIYKSSFISNVKEVPKTDLHNKQKKMLQDLGFKDVEKVDDLESGKMILAKHLRSVQVFIILDDIDHQDQLESLLPINKDSLVQGSVIIVTSRESGVLKSWGVSTIYKIRKLKPIHSKELFCWHAFGQPSPVDEYKSRVQKFLEVCDGLPLSLKVVGGLVREESQDFWDAQLKKVSRLLPKDVKSILKVSFDALDEEEKEIFLDISCFFIGEEKQLAVTVWDGSGWSGLHSLVTLENKCLVELDESNRITMHDHLRNLGKEIVLGKEIAKSPYRLWSPQQINDIEVEGQESVLVCGVRGIIAETDVFYEECMELVELVRRSGRRLKRRLEILIVRNNYFTEELATLSAGLVWLRWVNFPHTVLPSWISLKKLTVLELHDADKLEELWSETAAAPVQLIELNIFYARSFLRFPSSIGRLKDLKKISLDFGWVTPKAPFEGLPEGFCRLQSLEHLKLKRCEMLKLLPSKFGDLTNLRHLDLSECSGLMMLPASFKQLIHLQYIDLSFCSKLTFPPEILDNMRKLKTLNVYGCWELEELPQLITNQGSLKKLDVGSRRLMELPNSIGQLSKLEELRIESWLLRTLPPSIGNLSSLTRLVICCVKLESFPEALMQLSNLNVLDIQGCAVTELTILSGCFSSSLCNVKSISISTSPVTKISISEECCPSLESLRLSYNEQLEEIDRLPISLKAIKVHNCPKLKIISCNCVLVNLESLAIVDSGESLHELPNFAKSVSLKEFEIIRSAGQLKKVEGLEYCRSLKTLKAHTCWKEPVIQSLEYMESLRILDLLAWKISALEPCLRTIKNWPSECIICARTAPGVEKIMKSLTFPGLSLVNSCLRESSQGIGWLRWRRTVSLTLKCGQRHSTKEAAMLCFVINSIDDNTHLSLQMDSTFGIDVGKGKWVWIGFFPQSPPLESGDKFVLRKTFMERFSNPPDDGEMGMAVVGDKERVEKAFYQLLQHLIKMHGIWNRVAAGYAQDLQV